MSKMPPITWAIIIILLGCVLLIYAIARDSASVALGLLGIGIIIAGCITGAALEVGIDSKKDAKSRRIQMISEFTGTEQELTPHLISLIDQELSIDSCMMVKSHSEGRKTYLIISHAKSNEKK